MYTNWFIIIYIPMKPSNILFFDIETVSDAKSYMDLSPDMQGHRDHKMKYELTKTENEWRIAADMYTEKAGIYAEFGRIVCISVWYMAKDTEWSSDIRVKSFAWDDEKKLLEDFFELLNWHYHTPYSDYKCTQIQDALCGHNIKEFDVPYVCRRALIHGLTLPAILQIQGKKPRQTAHLLDTMQMWKFGDYKHYTKLSLMCHLFGIPTPKDDITWSDVTRVYREEEWGLERITTYCEKDVVATAALWEKLS